MIIYLLIGFNIITAIFALEMYLQNRALRSNLVEELKRDMLNEKIQ